MAPWVHGSVFLHVRSVPASDARISSQCPQSLLLGRKLTDVGAVHLDRSKEVLHLRFDGSSAINITLAEPLYRDE